MDISEEKTLGVEIVDHKKMLESAIKDLGEKGVRNIIVLSGMTNRDNVDILKQFESVDIIIAGGDNRGIVSGINVHRIDIPGGRGIIMLPDKNSFYTLRLRIDDRVSITGFQRNDIKKHTTTDSSYRVFLNRLALWRREYAKEGGKVIASTGEAKIGIDDLRAAELIRDYYNAEVSFIKKDTMKSLILEGDIRQYDLNNLSEDEFPLFRVQADRQSAD